MMKKNMLMMLIVIIVIIGVVFVFVRSPSAPKSVNSVPFSWKDEQVQELEWEGKNGSWVIKKQKDTSKEEPWTFNGGEASAKGISQLLQQVRALPADNGKPMKALELQQATSEFTITLTLDKDEQIVYQGVSSSNDLKTIWLLPALEGGLAYPLQADDVKELELGAPNIIANSQ